MENGSDNAKALSFFPAKKSLQKTALLPNLWSANYNTRQEAKTAPIP
jgi:hypothetical protein